MADTIIKIKDRKGDRGKFTGRGDTAPVAANLVTFLTGYSHVGADDYSTVTPGTLAAPKAVVQTDVVNNDLDFKAVIVYKDKSVPANPVIKRLLIPAPILDALNGICTILEGNMRAIPAIPPSGGVGDGGNSIVTKWETAMGVSAGDFEFLSGGFIKSKD